MKKLVVLGLLLFGFVLNSNAQADKIKALMIYQISIQTKFSGANATGDFVIGVKDNDGVFGVLQALAQSKKVGDRTIVLKKIASAADVPGCAVVFVSPGDVAGFAGACKSNGAMLFTEGKGNCAGGAMISYFVDGGKPNFEISESNMTAAGLTPSAKLLTMGQKV